MSVWAYVRKCCKIQNQKRCSKNISFENNPSRALITVHRQQCLSIQPSRGACGMRLERVEKSVICRSRAWSDNARVCVTVTPRGQIGSASNKKDKQYRLRRDSFVPAKRTNHGRVSAHISLSHIHGTLIHSC